MARPQIHRKSQHVTIEFSEGLQKAIHMHSVSVCKYPIPIMMPSTRGKKMRLSACLVTSAGLRSLQSGHLTHPQSTSYPTSNPTSRPPAT